MPSFNNNNNMMHQPPPPPPRGRAMNKKRPQASSGVGGVVGNNSHIDVAVLVQCYNTMMKVEQALKTIDLMRQHLIDLNRTILTMFYANANKGASVNILCGNAATATAAVSAPPTTVAATAPSVRQPGRMVGAAFYGHNT